MGDDSVDLRPLLRLIARLVVQVFRGWPIILGSIVVAVVATTALAALEPKTYEAIASVAIIRTRTQFAIDSSAKTLSSDQLSKPLASGQAYPNTQAVDPEVRARRFSLASLVNNGEIAELVAGQLAEQLSPAERVPSKLASSVQGRIAPGPDKKDAFNSDIIHIVATNPDPSKAALIANAWGRAYETTVNEVYGSPPSQATKIQRDADASKIVYDKAQKDLIDFRAQSRASEVQRQVGERQAALQALAVGRTRVISSTINSGIENNAKLYQAYLAAESDNLLLGLKAELGRKQQVLNARVDGQTKAEVDVITKQAAERQRVLDDAYAALARADNQLRHARMLRDKANAGGEAASSSFALVFLTTEAAGTSFPQSLDLRLDSMRDLLSKDVPRDSQALVIALEREKADIQSTIETQTQLLRSDEGLSLVEPSRQSQVDETILRQYADLFQAGELGKLSGELLRNNGLKDTSRRAAEDFLQLRDNGDILSFLGVDTALNRKINELESEIRNLLAILERDKGIEDDLTKARDLAAESYRTLSLKAIETGLAERLPGTEVKFAGAASAPTAPIPSKIPSRLLVVALAVVFGAIAAVAFGERERAKRGDSFFSSVLGDRGSVQSHQDEKAPRVGGVATT